MESSGLCPLRCGGEGTSALVATRAQIGLSLQTSADLDHNFFGDQQQQLRVAQQVAALRQWKRAKGCLIIAGCFFLGLTAPIVIAALI